MANYCCTIRTNYFHVKDPERFMNLMDKVYGSESEVEVWWKNDDAGLPMFAFGTYGGIGGVLSDPDDEADETDYDVLIDELQHCVADDDAILISESGEEKLRYVIGTASIITSRDYFVVDLHEEAIKKAKSMLNNQEWKTDSWY